MIILFLLFYEQSNLLIMTLMNVYIFLISIIFIKVILNINN